MSHHPTKFGSHSHCGCGNIMVLVCHVISQSHVMKRSRYYMGRYPSKPVTILQNVVTMATLAVDL